VTELRASRHGIPVDLDPANPRFPSCEPSQSATQLKLHTVLPQVSEQFLVGIGGRHILVGIVRAVA
jgi:hypothetical protein